MRGDGSVHGDPVSAALLIGMAVTMAFFTLFSGFMAILQH